MAPPVLKKKLKKVQEMRTDTPAMLDALDSLADFYPRANTLDARRGLRSDLEGRGLALVQQFIAEFEPVQKKIDGLGRDVGVLNQVCDDLQARLRESAQHTAAFAEQLRALSEKRAAVTERAALMDKFMRRFKLSDAQLAALRRGPTATGGDGNNNNNEGGNDNDNDNDPDDDDGALFFGALEDVQRIRGECEELMSTQFQNAGLELFDAMAGFQEQAHEQLFAWVRAQLQALDAEFPEPGRALRRGILTLAQAPAYHDSARDCVADTRAAALAHRFAAALTFGGSGPNPRPIEMHAHDPLRYVGDMLAWVHQAMAVERTLVATLFPPPPNANAGNSDKGAAASQETGAAGASAEEKEAAAKSAEATSAEAKSAEAKSAEAKSAEAKSAEAKSAEAAAADEEEEAARPALTNSDTLNAVFRGVERSLGGRVRQVLSSTLPLVTGFKLITLLDYYVSTLAGVLGTAEGAAAVALRALHAEAEAAFFASVRAQCDKLLAAPPAYPRDLSVALEVSELVRRLSEVLASAATAQSGVFSDVDVLSASASASASASDTNDAADAADTDAALARREAAFAPVLDAFIEPLLATCSRSASGLGPSDAAVYNINNLMGIQSALTRYDFTVAWVHRLTAEVGDWTDRLVREQAEALLRLSGTSELLAKIAKIAEADVAGAGAGAAEAEAEAGDGGAVSATVTGRRTVTLRERPGLELAACARVLAAFYKSIVSMDVPEYDRLSSPRLRASARSATAQMVGRAYEDLHKALSDQQRFGFTPEELAPVLLHDPDQVRQLLDAL